MIKLISRLALVFALIVAPAHAATPVPGGSGTASNLRINTIGVANGSAAAPSIFAKADTNTGVYWCGADTLCVTTGGTAELTIGASTLLYTGNTGIGAASSGTERLRVSKGDAGSEPAWSAVDVAIVENVAGTNAAIQVLTSNAANGGIQFSDTDARGRGAVIYEHASDALVLFAAGAEHLRLAAGEVQINNSVDLGAYALQVTGAAYLSGSATIGNGTTTLAATVDGAASGAAGGGGFFAKNGGTTVAAMANKSSIIGGAYSATATFYGAGDIEINRSGTVVGTFTAGGFNGAVGATTASTGAFTALSASGETLLAGAADAGAYSLQVEGDMILTNNTNHRYRYQHDSDIRTVPITYTYRYDTLAASCNELDDPYADFTCSYTSTGLVQLTHASWANYACQATVLSSSDRVVRVNAKAATTIDIRTGDTGGTAQQAEVHLLCYRN